MNEAALGGFLLVLARVSVFVAFLPLFARRQLPVTVKAALSVALSLFWFGVDPQRAVHDGATLMGDGSVGALVLVREMAAGWLLATLAGWMLVPARIAGSWVGQEMGLQMGQQLDPTGTGPVSDVAVLFESLGILMFFVLNLHQWAFRALHWSFDFLRDDLLLFRLPLEWLVALVAEIEQLGLLVAAPVAICLAVLNFVVLYLNKASPSLNLFTIGAPLRLVSGLVCLVLFWPVLSGNIRWAMMRMDSGLLEVLSRTPGPQ